MGPRQPHSTVLTTLTRSNDRRFSPPNTFAARRLFVGFAASGIPTLTRSSLHRCLQRHGISRLPEIEDKKPPRKKFAKYPISYFHIDIAEVSAEEGRLYLFVATRRTSKFAYAELHSNQTRDRACRFLRQLVAVVPYHIHTILTDNRFQFTNRKQANGRLCIYRGRICRQHGIEHRLTKVNHPWTNGQVERMNRTIKEATVKRYYYETHQQLKEHSMIDKTQLNKLFMGLFCKPRLFCRPHLQTTEEDISKQLDLSNL